MIQQERAQLKMILYRTFSRFAAILLFLPIFVGITSSGGITTALTVDTGLGTVVPLNFIFYALLVLAFIIVNVYQIITLKKQLNLGFLKYSLLVIFAVLTILLISELDLHFTQVKIILSLGYHVLLTLAFIWVFEGTKQDHHSLRTTVLGSAIIFVGITAVSFNFYGVTPVFFAAKNIIVYNWEQYYAFYCFSVICFGYFTEHKISKFVYLIFVVFLGSLLFYFSGSRLIFVSFITFLFAVVAERVSKVQGKKLVFFFGVPSKIMLIIVAISCYFLLQAFGVNSGDEGDTDRGFFINLLFSALDSPLQLIFPFTNKEVFSLYSVHNNYLEIYRSIGIFATIFFYWILLNIVATPGPDFYFLFAICILASLVVNPFTHIFTTQILSFYFAITVVSRNRKIYV